MWEAKLVITPLSQWAGAGAGAGGVNCAVGNRREARDKGVFRGILAGNAAGADTSLSVFFLYFCCTLELSGIP